MDNATTVRVTRTDESSIETTLGALRRTVHLGEEDERSLEAGDSVMVGGDDGEPLLRLERVGVSS